MMIFLQLYFLLMTACIITCDGRSNSDWEPSQQCPVCPDYQTSQQCPACQACPDFALGLIPISNIEASMGGFNPILSNPNKQPDPGLKGQIFEPYTQQEDGSVKLSPFITKAWANQHCTLSFVARTIKNYNEYRQSKTSSYSFGMETGFSASADIWLASFKSSFGFGLELDNEEQKIRKFFQETSGEIVISSNECRTHTIEVASYVTPSFTASFEEGLKSLHYAAMDPNSTESKNAYIRFISIFGTHYLKKTHLGAKLIFEKRFTSKSTNGEDEERRKNCVQASASGSVGGSIVFIGSAEASFSTNTHRCSDSTSGSSYFTDNGIQAEKVTSIGSLPSKDPEAWARNIVDSVPISFELEPLSALFEYLNFYFASFDSSDTSIVFFNGSVVRRFFDDMSGDYCRLAMGRDCTTTTKGCGVNSLCSSEEDCENDPTLPLGHRCDRRYRGIIIVGGYDSSLSRLSTTEAIATYQRPNLPANVHGLSLARVRDTLYSCGGNDGKGYIDNCHKLLSDATAWSITVPLPVKMAYHTAVTVGQHIWYVYKSQLYRLDTNTDKFRIYTLPFIVKNYHCAVSNDTHSYILAAGSEHNQVWVNKEASSPTQWQRVAYLPRHGRGLACLWPAGNAVFITGGGWSSGNAYTSILNTDSNTITYAADMMQGRAWHKMMILDGNPAVVGGGYKDDSTGVHHWPNIIETYDTATNQWQRHLLALQAVRGAFGLAQLAG